MKRNNDYRWRNNWSFRRVDCRDHSRDHQCCFNRSCRRQLYHEQAQEYRQPAQDAASLRIMQTETEGHETHLRMGEVRSMHTETEGRETHLWLRD